MEMQSTAAVTEPIQKGGGESPASWDDLEAVNSMQSQVLKNETKQELKAEKEARKELGGKPEKEEKSEPKKQEVKKAPVEKEKEKPSQESKRLKIKHNEQDYDLPLEMKIPVKIDGKTEEVALSEAIARYSQQKHLDKIYSDFKSDKVSFEQQRQKMKTFMDQAKNLLVDKKDFRGFIDTIAEPLGLEPNVVYQDTVKALEQKLEEAQHLSPEEKRIKALEDELNYHKQRDESIKQKHVQAESRQKLEASVKDVLSAHQIDMGTFANHFETLVKLGIPKEEISAEQIGEFHKNMNTISYIENTLKSINSDLASEDEIKSWYEKAKSLNATDAEISAAIELIHGQSAEKKLNKKIDKSLKRASLENPVKNPDKDVSFWDDL